MAKQKQKDYQLDLTADRLFDAFDDLVDSGIDNIKINKNDSKSSFRWTIQILNHRGKILAESKSWLEKFREESA
ncbi:MAG TPA: hypothetical protein DCM40_01370 [Maribacter sp.]|nr:hypothetical protein [Maribacter sp.]